jgi:hypothetical protein
MLIFRSPCPWVRRILARHGDLPRPPAAAAPTCTAPPQRNNKREP